MRQLYDVSKEGPVLRVRVHPGAGRDAIVGVHNDSLKVRVAAPPVSGRANDAVLALLARELGVDRADLEITVGGSGPAKRVRIAGLEPDELDARLDRALDESSSLHRSTPKR